MSASGDFDELTVIVPAVDGMSRRDVTRLVHSTIRAPFDLLDVDRPTIVIWRGRRPLLDLLRKRAR